jgi:curved DNA-binding protein
MAEIPGLPDHYATLGVDPDATPAEIRNAYRRLSKRHHPDANGGSDTSVRLTQALNAAHEVLRDPARRRAYDEEREIAADRNHHPSAPAPGPVRRGRTTPVTREVRLTIEEFLKGASLTLTVDDPASTDGPESYRLEVPAGTAPKTKFKIPRSGSAGGLLVATVSLRPHPRFRTRGSDVRADLTISAQRAATGGTESFTGPDGRPVRVPIPAHVARDAIVRLPGLGLPRPRGGHGDLLVRVKYRPDVHVQFQKKG